MMPKLILTSATILEKRFKQGIADYDALEVDKFLDQIKLDYEVWEAFIKDTLPKLEQEVQLVASLRKRILELEVELAKTKEKLGVLKGNDTATINLTNIDYIKRIGDLERALYQAGIDPNKIK
jgi:DivIVA domain-containing protein